MAPAGNPPVHLDVGRARMRAAQALGATPEDLVEPQEHRWGWSFVASTPSGGTERVFVDGERGLVATAETGDAKRIATLERRGPRGVPPWSPPARSWWHALRSALGFGDRPRS